MYTKGPYTPPGTEGTMVTFPSTIGGGNWNGFSYDPTLIVLDPNDDEAPKTPGLSGDIPIDVPAGGEVSGLFTEDQLREASIDLDQVTRGNVNPFRASLTISKNATSFQPLTPPRPGDDMYMQTPIGDPIPRCGKNGSWR